MPQFERKKKLIYNIPNAKVGNRTVKRRLQPCPMLKVYITNLIPSKINYLSPREMFKVNKVKVNETPKYFVQAEEWKVKLLLTIHSPQDFSLSGVTSNLTLSFFVSN